jgi:hypothetical protein
VISLAYLFPYNKLLEHMIIFPKSIHALAMSHGFVQGLTLLAQHLRTNFLLYNTVVLAEVLGILLSCRLQPSLKTV